MDNGWGGTIGPDDNLQGLYQHGPLPAANPLQRMIQSSKAATDPLPPHLASLVLTRQAKLERRLARMLARARVSPTVASLPVEEVTKRRLKPLRCGR
jgi:hypothetical protein